MGFGWVAVEDLLQDGLLAAYLRWDRMGAMEYPAAYVRTIITIAAA